MQHKLTAWMDGFQRHVFCQVCGKDDPPESDECPGIHPKDLPTDKFEKIEFASGLPDK